MRYATSRFSDDTHEMEPALYCTACAFALLRPDAGTHWETVLLSDDDDFSCDHCFTDEADWTPINGSAWLQDDLEPRLNA